MDNQGVKYLTPQEIGREQGAEVLLKENHNRWVMFPIEYHGFWGLYKEIENNFWAAENYRFSDDRDAVSRLSEDIKNSLIQVVYYHGKLDHSDMARPAMVTLGMLSEVQIPEMRAFYGIQVSYENIHSEVFGSMSLVLRGSCDANTGKEKIDWLSSKFASAECYYARVIIQCISKLVFRSCFGILRAYLEKERLMPTFVEAMKMVEKDIGIHLKHAFAALGHLKLRLSKDYILSLLEEAVNLELEFCKTLLPLDTLGLTIGNLCDYIRNNANQCLLIAGHPEHYRLDNSLEWLSFTQLKLNISDALAKKAAAKPIPIPEVGIGNISFDEDF